MEAKYVLSYNPNNSIDYPYEIIERCQLMDGTAERYHSRYSNMESALVSLFYLAPGAITIAEVGVIDNTFDVR